MKKIEKEPAKKFPTVEEYEDFMANLIDSHFDNIENSEPKEGNMGEDRSLIKYHDDLKQIEKDREAASDQLEKICQQYDEIEPKCSYKKTIISGGITVGLLLATYATLSFLICLLFVVSLFTTYFLSDEVDTNRRKRDRLEKEISKKQASIEVLNETEFQTEFKLLEAKEEKE
jgi:hypothetical protein